MFSRKDDVGRFSKTLGRIRSGRASAELLGREEEPPLLRWLSSRLYGNGGPSGPVVDVAEAAVAGRGAVESEESDPAMRGVSTTGHSCCCGDLGRWE